MSRESLVTLVLCLGSWAGGCGNQLAPRPQLSGQDQGSNTDHEVFDIVLSDNPRRCPVQSLDVSQDGSMIGVALGFWIKGGGWGELRLWDVRTRTTRASLIRNYPRPVTSVTFSTDGRLIAAGSGDGTIRTCDIAAVSRSD
jgi:WD40 repeat protein